ncbi:serine/threonine protein kinase [Corallococcus sp. H22C18031201]|uniref:serine/threonine protein kinase n=1 Tax=Citreicoccus inhibens TaxID=2849499 RepID=UPI000E75DA6E|nr:serine/threonine protein kinase [Citreicoccus inhibens]MBU8896731.1 serine/threonine protein kinase [Citreicoccus inhibens]RJS22025.1 serine/threonine protein kinase [Corallococcus sp. H22C18031201]
MDTLSQPTRTLNFDAFWRWLQEHTNCILRCGSADTTLFDHDDFHWVLMEEERQHVVQVLKGKSLVAEMVMAGREVTEVTLSADPETGSEGHFLVELFGGPKEDPQVIYHFIMAHGMEPAAGHQGFKH